MLYLDTLLLVAVLTNEAETERMQTWLGEQPLDDLAVSDWAAPELSSALAIKLRTGQIGVDHRTDALAGFARLAADGFAVFPCHDCTFARRRALPINMRLVYMPEMLCISRFAPITTRRSVYSTIGWPVPARRSE